MLSLFRRLARDVGGASAVECTLIVSLIAVAAIASMRSVGNGQQRLGADLRRGRVERKTKGGPEMGRPFDFTSIRSVSAGKNNL